MFIHINLHYYILTLHTHIFNLLCSVCSIRTNRMHYFTLKLFRKLTSTRFEQVYCSSSGDTFLYTQQLVCVMRLCWLAACCYICICCIYRKVPPDDEQ